MRFQKAGILQVSPSKPSQLMLLPNLSCTDQLEKVPSSPLKFSATLYWKLEDSWLWDIVTMQQDSLGEDDQRLLL